VLVFPWLGIRANTYSRPPNLNEASSRQVQSAADVLRTTKEFLRGCPSDIYVIVSQPNLNVADFSSSTALPRLQRFVSRNTVKTKIRVSEVIGELSTRDLEDYLESHCGAAVIEADQLSMINSSRLQLRVVLTSIPQALGFLSVMAIQGPLSSVKASHRFP
jgi:hypothetical protein